MEQKTSDILSDKGFLIVSGLSFLAMVIRTVFLAVNTPLMDGDEAVVGLMAKNIAEGNDLPFYFWGQHYMGALEAYLAAGLFRISGPSVFLLKLVPALFWYMSIPILYLLWLRASDRIAALLAAILCIFPGYFLSEWISKARGGYSEIVFLGALALYLYSTLESSPRGQTRLFAIGFLHGAALWVNAQSISFIIPVTVHYVLSGSRGLRTYFTRLLRISAGAFPMLSAMAYYDLTHDLGSLGFLLRGHKGEHLISGMIGRAGNLFTEALPVLAGAFYPWTLETVLPVVSHLIYGIFLGSLVYFGYAVYKKKIDLNGPAWMFAWSFILLLLMYAASRFGGLAPREPRYLITAVFFMPFCVSYFICSLYRNMRSVAVLSAVVLLCSNLFTGYRYYVHKDPPVFRQLAGYLESRNITNIFADYWILMNVIYYSGERITGSSNIGPDINDRYPVYRQSMCMARPENIAFVVDGSEYGRAVTEQIRSAGMDHHVSMYNGFTVIDGFNSDPRRLQIASVGKTCVDLP